MVRIFFGKYHCGKIASLSVSQGEARVPGQAELFLSETCFQTKLSPPTNESRSEDYWEETNTVTFLPHDNVTLGIKRAV